MRDCVLRDKMEPGLGLCEDKVDLFTIIHTMGLHGRAGTVRNMRGRVPLFLRFHFHFVKLRSVLTPLYSVQSTFYFYSVASRVGFLLEISRPCLVFRFIDCL